MAATRIGLRAGARGVLSLALMVAVAAHAQAPPAPAPAGDHGPARPPLFLREEWQQGPKGGEHPVTGASLGNPNLELTQIVPAGEIELTGTAGDEGNPVHVWLGLCTAPCGVALRDKQRYADLTGLARIRWNTKMSGFHQVRPIVRLADGTWLAADHGVGTARDWLVSELFVADLHWLRLDIARGVTTGPPLEHVDLSRVDQIGFIDLMPGSGHGPGGWSDVAQIEVYAKSVPR